LSTGGGKDPGAPQADELLLQRRDKTPRLGIGIGRENIYTNHRVRLPKLL